MEDLSKKTACSYASLSVVALRLFLAWIFITSGAGKLFGLLGGPGVSGFTGFLAKIGIPNPSIMAYVVGWSELISGILLAAGFMTRAASVLIMIIMAVAIVKIHPHIPDFNYPAVVFLGALVLLETGSGAFSIDKMIRGKK